MNLLYKDVTQMGRDLAHLETVKLDRQIALDKFADLTSKDAELYTFLSMNKNHLCTVENFIEKYLPIRVLSQISEIFQTIWPKHSS